jgi:hypothetical protein
MLDFIDDENTKYDEAVLKAFLNEKNTYGYIAADNGKAIGFAYGYVLNEPNGQKVYYLHAIDVYGRMAKSRLRNRTCPVYSRTFENLGLPQNVSGY